MTIYRKVKSVTDGDTFKVRTRIWGSQNVRIAGLNAPEKYQFGGKQATTNLRKLIQGKTVTLQPVGKSYGRTVAKVRIGGRLIK